MMKSPLKRKLPGLLAVAVLALGVVLATACGGEAEAPGGKTPTGGTVGSDPVILDISQDDNFFEPNVFTVAPGQRVTFRIANDGAAIHNKRIAGSDGEFNTDDDAVSDPEMVSPGEAAVLSWTAPGQPATIDFRCDFHPGEQTGTITVQ